MNRSMFDTFEEEYEQDKGSSIINKPKGEIDMEKTDYEKVIDLFEELEIGYSISKYPIDRTEGVIIALNTGDAKIEGYNGFSSWYSFTVDGKFIEVTNLE